MKNICHWCEYFCSKYNWKQHFLYELDFIIHFDLLCPFGEPCSWIKISEQQICQKKCHFIYDAYRLIGMASKPSFLSLNMTLQLVVVPPPPNQVHGFDHSLTCLTLCTHEISVCPVVGCQTVWMKESVTLSLTAHQWIPKCFTDLKYDRKSVHLTCAFSS